MLDENQITGAKRPHNSLLDQVAFLRQALGAREWRATLHLSDSAALTPAIAHELQQRGYQLSAPSSDASGRQALEVHHLGTRPNLGGYFQHYGTMQGLGYLLTHPAKAGYALQQGAANLPAETMAVLRDPARLNGVVYMTAEAFLLRGAGGNPHGRWYTPKNLLQGLSAAFYASQSLAYTFWAKKGHERLANDLQQQLNKTNHNDFSALPNAEPLNEREHNGPFDKLKNALETHPIQAGAILNNAGMASYIGHAILERRFRIKQLAANPSDTKLLNYIHKGFWTDVIGCSASIAGWSSLMLPAKEYEHYSDNNLTRLYQRWRENPQTLAGITTLISSSGRIKGAYDKGNTYQLIGESIYIPGDLMLFFVKNHEYGASIGEDLDALCNQVAPLINTQPMLVSPEKQTEFFDHTAQYLAKQIAALSRKEVELGPLQKTLSKQLSKRCKSTLTQNFDAAICEAQALVDLFPAREQTQMIQQIAKSVTQLNAAHITEQEITAKLHTGISALKAPNEQTLAQQIGKLALSISEQNAAQNALTLRSKLAIDTPRPLIDTPSATVEAPHKHAAGRA